MKIINRQIICLAILLGLTNLTLGSESTGFVVSLSIEKNSDAKDKMKVWLCDNSEYMKGYFKVLSENKPIEKQTLNCNSFGFYPIDPIHKTTDAYVQPSESGVNVHNHFVNRICYINFNNNDLKIKPMDTFKIPQEFLNKDGNKVLVSCEKIRK